ncbi:MAG: cyanophycinase [Gammaproteobacteria bacterium]|nr:MAG: cyanophycinase [Gammaproteobacteria bacterium]
MTSRWTRLLALFLTISLCLVGCGDPEPPANPGHLVIIGGGLKPDNTEIYARMVELVGDTGHWAVLPTASGVPESAGATAVQRLARYGAEARLIDIRAGDVDKARDPDYVEQLTAARGLFFTGGSQQRIVDVYRPEAGDTPAYQAMRRLLAQGGVIAGTSAGAAMMSNPMIERGDAHTALTRGRAYGPDRDAEDGVSIAKGMGLFPYGMTDQHFLSRGRLGRLIVALDETRFARGYGVDDNRAIHVDLASARIEALGGPGALLLLDAGDVRRNGDVRLGYRVAMLGSGDVVDGLSGRVMPARGKVPAGRPPGNIEELPVIEDAWSSHAIDQLILLLAQQPATSARILDSSFELVFEEDDATQYWVAPEGDAASLTVIGLRLDVFPRSRD